METGGIGARGMIVRRVVVVANRQGNENAIIPSLHMVVKHVLVTQGNHVIVTPGSVQVK